VYLSAWLDDHISGSINRRTLVVKFFMLNQIHKPSRRSLNPILSESPLELASTGHRRSSVRVDWVEAFVVCAALVIKLLDASRGKHMILVVLSDLGKGVFPLLRLIFKRVLKVYLMIPQQWYQSYLSYLELYMFVYCSVSVLIWIWFLVVYMYKSLMFHSRERESFCDILQFFNTIGNCMTGYDSVWICTSSFSFELFE
jgi:hypothetical protein